MWDVIAYLALLVVAFYMLSKGSDWFVDGAVGIATKLRIPQLVIGLTIVAMGTSAPEAAVSISSAVAGSPDITIGNVVGSNILNVLIILGISATITSLAVDKNTFVVDIPVVLFATVLMAVFGLDGTIVWWEALIILVVFVSYITYLILKAMKERKATISADVQQTNDSLTGSELKEEPTKQMSVFKSILFAILGLGLIIAGSQGAVESATFLAKKMGVSDKLIGLTIVALGTSLPELFTSVKAALKHNADIAIGNIVGSNIFNILFIVGLTGLVKPIPFAPSFMIDTAISFVAVVFLLVASLKGKKLTRWAGITMLVGYAIYFVYLLMENGIIAL